MQKPLPQQSPRFFFNFRDTAKAHPGFIENRPSPLYYQRALTIVESKAGSPAFNDDGYFYRSAISNYVTGILTGAQPAPDPLGTNTAQLLLETSNMNFHNVSYKIDGNWKEQVFNTSVYVRTHHDAFYQLGWTYGDSGLVDDVVNFNAAGNHNVVGTGKSIYFVKIETLTDDWVRVNVTAYAPHAATNAAMKIAVVASLDATRDQPFAGKNREHAVWMPHVDGASIISPAIGFTVGAVTNALPGQTIFDCENLQTVPCTIVLSYKTYMELDGVIFDIADESRNYADSEVALVLRQRNGVIELLDKSNQVICSVAAKSNTDAQTVAIIIDKTHVQLISSASTGQAVAHNLPKVPASKIYFGNSRTTNNPLDGAIALWMYYPTNLPSDEVANLVAVI